MDIDSTAQSKRFWALLLVFRWLALSPALWLLFSPAQPLTLTRQTLWLIGVIGGSTLLVTLFQAQLFRLLWRYPWLLSLDLLLAVIVLALSGADDSLFVLYALGPLLAGAIFFPFSQLLALSGLFVISYLLAVLVVNDFSGLTVDLGRIYEQIMAALLLPWMAQYFIARWRGAEAEAEKAQQEIAELSQNNSALLEEYTHLNIIYEVTSFLQGVSSAQAAQKLLLNAVIAKLGFSRAVMALVNQEINRLEEWRSAPETKRNTLFSETLPITPNSGLLAQIVIDGQAQWIGPQHKITNNRHLNGWLGREHWLVLPVEYQGRPVAALMVSGEATRNFNFSDRVWATLTSIVGQTGVTLGTLADIQTLAQEKERNRIARNIHDSVVQSLFGMALTLDACIKLLPGSVNEVQTELTNLRDAVDQVRQAVRESLIEQWSTSMTGQKFKAGLRKYMASISINRVFHIDFHINGDFDGLPVHIQQTLYRISQEALTNTNRHAGVDCARLYLYVEPDEVFLSIRDKGKGFAPGQVMAQRAPDRHFGLQGMQERAQAIGGLCDILSQPEQGAQILVRVPLPGKAG